MINDSLNQNSKDNLIIEEKSKQSKWQLLKQLRKPEQKPSRIKITTASKILQFLFRGNTKVYKQIEPKSTRLGADQIRKKFRRARIILKSVFILKKISWQIIQYGTSGNLFNIQQRDRPALKRYLFPLLYQEDNEEQQDLEFPLLHPDGIIKTIWNPILALIIIYTATFLPYRISFYIYDSTDSWLIFDNVIDALFWMDLFIQLISAYKDEEQKLVRTRKAGWFFVDFFSSLPLDTILAGDQNYQQYNNKLFKLTKLPRVYRLFRITKIFKFFRYINESKLMVFLEMNTAIVKLCQMLIIFALMIHLMACIWAYISILEDNYQNWQHFYSIDELQPMSQYIASIYFTLTVVTTVGYGDITATTNAEMILVMLYMIIGVAFYSGAIGYLGSIFQNMDRKRLWMSSVKKTIFKKILSKNSNLFSNIMQINNALPGQYKIKLHYYNYIQNSDEILQELPIQLKNDIVFSIHGGIMADLQFLKISENKSFAIRIVPLLRPLFHSSKEYIYQYLKKYQTQYKIYLDEGIYSRRKYLICFFQIIMIIVFCLAKGRVVYLEEFEINLHQQQTAKRLIGFKSMINGSYFGEIEIIEERKRDYFVQCEQISEFYVLDTKVFKNFKLLICQKYQQFQQIVPSEFPGIYQKLLSIAIERSKRNKFGLDQLKQVVERINHDKQFMNKNNQNTYKATFAKIKTTDKKKNAIIHSKSLEQIIPKLEKKQDKHLSSKKNQFQQCLDRQTKQIQELDSKLLEMDQLIGQLRNL